MVWPSLVFVSHSAVVFSSVACCQWFQSEFARASLHYGYDRSSVLFCCLSVDAFPKLVDQYQLITPAQNRFSHELPTVMMFAGGKLCARLPEAGRKTMMDEVNLVRAMDMEKRARLEPSVLKQLEAKVKGTPAPKTEANLKKDKKNK